MQEFSVDIVLEHPDDVLALFGSNERHLRLMEENLGVVIHARTERVQILGDDEEAVEIARLTIQALLVLVGRGMVVNTSDVVTALSMAQNGTIDKFVALYEEEIIKDNAGKPIRIKTLGQKVYVDSVKNHDVVFGIGPAGTGKTFLAVTLAVTALKRGQVKRIILTRPAVEAGESLGFLPGDLKEKVDPYLRPVYDALYQILGKEQTTRLMEREIIEIAPLAYMRGRTLDDAFVILDEAQNTTIMQMKMFLTRLGFNSKMIVNGDISQIDLPRQVKSGLIDATQKLQEISQIDFVYLSAKDVVRHPVVAEIINAYEGASEKEQVFARAKHEGLVNDERSGESAENEKWSGEKMMETLSSHFMVSSIKEDELQKVLDLYESNPLFFKHCPPRPTLETVKEDLSRLPDGKSSKDKFYVGFWDENDLVAVMDFVRAYPNEETVFIGFFMLHKTYQGKGLGSQIIQEASAYFAKDFKKMRLAYVKGNPQAQHFWEKQGFTPTGREVAQELYTVVIMEKAL